MNAGLLKICPHCGTDIAFDKPIIMNDFMMIGPGYPLLYKGKKLPLTHNCALICYSLMKAYPGYLTTTAIAERLGSEAEHPSNLVKVYVCRIRAIFIEFGAPRAIETIPQHNAYVWDPR